MAKMQNLNDTLIHHNVYLNIKKKQIMFDHSIHPLERSKVITNCKLKYQEIKTHPLLISSNRTDLSLLHHQQEELLCTFT